MTNNLPAIYAQKGIPADVVNILKNVIFPDAKDDNVIALAWEYCKHRKLDIMKKPVHIVPVMRKGKWTEGIWPSIYEYRATAARTGLYAGKSAPKFGKLKKKKFTKKEVINNQTIETPIEITFPEYCEITVYKILDKKPRAFSGRVYWEEAAVFTKGSPNSMWSKRIHGQLSKCAEAEALRSAFPDELGSLVTAEEMEGRDITNVQDAAQAGQNPNTNAGFADRVKKDAEKGVIIDNQPDPTVAQQEGQETDTPPWDASGINIGGERKEIGFESAAGAAKYLMKIMASHKTRASRNDLLNENLDLVNELHNEGQLALISEMHTLVDAGE